MQSVILKFISVLRDNKIRISISESQDALNSLLLSDSLLDREVFKEILQCTLVKNSEDIRIFETLFEIFFSSNPNESESEINKIDKALLVKQLEVLKKERENLKKESQGSLTSARQENKKKEEEKKKNEKEKQEENRQKEETELKSLLDDALHPLTKSLVSGNSTLLENMIDEKIQLLEEGWAKNPARKPTTYEKNIEESFDWPQVETELDFFLYKALIQKLDVEQLSSKVDQNKKLLKKLIKQTILHTLVESQEYQDHEFSPKDRGWEQHSGVDKLYEQDWLCKTTFDDLKPEDLKKLARYAQKVATILATKISSRQRLHKHKGLVDFRNTTRKSVAYGGLPVQLIRQVKKVQKTSLVLICDVSGSVIKPAKFLLQFMYALQKCVRGKIRSFIFVSKLDEITEFFHGREVKAATDLAMGEADVDYRGRSDFGAAFSHFTDNYFEAITAKSIVIVMGDARSNRRDPRSNKLKLIQEKAKKLIWLIPEDKEEWNTGDSIMSEYKKYSDEIYEVRNFETLETFAKNLML